MRPRPLGQADRNRSRQGPESTDDPFVAARGYPTRKLRISGSLLTTECLRGCEGIPSFRTGAGDSIWGLMVVLVLLRVSVGRAIADLRTFSRQGSTMGTHGSPARVRSRASTWSRHRPQDCRRCPRPSLILRRHVHLRPAQKVRPDLGGSRFPAQAESSEERCRWRPAPHVDRCWRVLEISGDPALGVREFFDPERVLADQSIRA